MTIKSDMEKMRDTLNRWIAIMITTMIILIGGSSTAGVMALNNKERIERIQEDYLPYYAFQYIIESNNKLMNILTAIDLKDDQRYEEAMKEWSELQQEIIKQYGQNKRSVIKEINK